MEVKLSEGEVLSLFNRADMIISDSLSDSDGSERYDRLVRLFKEMLAFRCLIPIGCPDLD